MFKRLKSFFRKRPKSRVLEPVENHLKVEVKGF